MLVLVVVVIWYLPIWYCRCRPCFRFEALSSCLQWIYNFTWIVTTPSVNLFNISFVKLCWFWKVFLRLAQTIYVIWINRVHFCRPCPSIDALLTQHNSASVASPIFGGALSNLFSPVDPILRQGNVLLNYTGVNGRTRNPVQGFQILMPMSKNWIFSAESWSGQIG